MAHRPGGQDPAEVQRALEMIGAAHSIADLERAVQVPIVRSPLLHAIIRQEYLRLRGEHSPYLEGFTPRYEDLFRLLHEKTAQELFESVERAEPKAAPTPSSVFAPPFFAQIARALAGRLPTPESWPLHPGKDMGQIQGDVDAAVGQHTALPAYAPSPGSCWSAIVVVCAACRRQWLTLRAYAVDLLQAPDLAGPLAAGQINNAACPHCAEVVCYPLVVWIQDGPGSGDALAALSCAWRLAASALIYQPTPGTRRVEENDRILEIRFDRLLSRIAWSETQEAQSPSQPRMQTMAAAYTVQELQSYLEQATAEQIPLAMRTVVAEMVRKVKSGLLPLHQAVAAVLETVSQVAADWPLIAPADILNYGDPYEYLFEAAVAEAVAQARGVPTGVRALLAVATCEGLLALGEMGLAEAALARAEDFFAAVPADDPQRDVFRLGVTNARMDVDARLGRQQEAERELRALQSSPLLDDSRMETRVTRQRLASSQAVVYYESGRLAEALEALSPGVATLRAMLAEASTWTEEDRRVLIPQIQRTLSGDLANLAAVLTDLAEYLEIHRILTSAGLPQAEGARLIAQMMQAGEDPRRAIDQVEAALPALGQMFPQGYGPSTLVDQALRLLEEALELSEAVEGWEFAGIQAHRLAVLLDKLGRHEEAEAAARKAIAHAARIGDHTRAWTAHSYLADRAMKRGDGPQALLHLRAGARHWSQGQVGLGYHAATGPEAVTLADAALQTVAMGADAIGAMMVAESLKAATTSASMVTGVPVQPAGPEGQASATHLQELEREREALRLKALWSPKDETIAHQLEQVQRALEQEREQLSVRDPRFGRWVDATDLDVSDGLALQRRLAHFGAATTLLGILPVGDSIWTYMVWADGKLLSQRAWPRSHGGSAKPWDAQALAALAKATLEPMEERLGQLEPADRLVISTASGSYRIPFSALPYRGGYLCEHVSMSLVQSIGVLEACLARPSREVQSALCLGGPLRPDVGSLPGALEEARQIAAQFAAHGKKSDLFTGNGATVPALRSNAGQHDVIHIACHALAARSPGEPGGLLLSPDLRIKDSGVLTEDRVLSELLLLPGCLVNLAGCGTGTQVESEAPLLGGLIPAFLVAGAGSVVGSLWPIQDATAVRFQTEFYQELLAGSSPAQSLSRTQSKCVAGACGPEMQDPAVWASYVVYGVG